MDILEPLCLVLMLMVTLSQGQIHMQQQQQAGQQQAGQHPSNRGSPLQDQTKDREHIMEHYDGVIDSGNKERMSEEELNFHYFKVHDYDHNNMLDGIELVSALTHYHRDPNEVDNTPVTADNELSVMIDDILAETDMNNDGYIDYGEFIMSTRGEGEDIIQPPS